MQHKIQYQRELLFYITEKCAKVDDTHKKITTFISSSINDLDSHLHFYDDFQFFLASPQLIEMLDISTWSNFFAFILALSLMMIFIFSLYGD